MARGVFCGESLAKPPVTAAGCNAVVSAMVDDCDQEVRVVPLNNISPAKSEKSRVFIKNVSIMAFPPMFQHKPTERQGPVAPSTAVHLNT